MNRSWSMSISKGVINISKLHTPPPQRACAYTHTHHNLPYGFLCSYLIHMVPNKYWLNTWILSSEPVELLGLWVPTAMWVIKDLQDLCTSALNLWRCGRFLSLGCPDNGRIWSGGLFGKFSNESLIVLQLNLKTKQQTKSNTKTKPSCMTTWCFGSICFSVGCGCWPELETWGKAFVTLAWSVSSLASPYFFSPLCVCHVFKRSSFKYILNLNIAVSSWEFAGQ